MYDVGPAAARLTEEYVAILRSVVAGGRFAAGPELAAFEAELAAYLGLGHAVGVKSGTDALVLSLRALGIGPGDEVITTSFTFFATAEAILLVGAKPVFADIELDTLCLNPDACASAITPGTKAMLLVDLFGHCPDLSRFVELCRRHGLTLIEDASQAVGSTWQGRKLGSIGDFGTFSFYPTKNLAALGDGGAVATNDPNLAQAVRELRHHGRNAEGRYTRVGYNSQLDEIQAAFLRPRLRTLDAENQRRRELAGRYDKALGSLVRLVRGVDDCVSNYHQYAILTPERDRLRAHLAENGIETGCYYETPVHLEPVLQGSGLGHNPNSPSGIGLCPALCKTNQACSEILNLPIRPSLTNSEQDIVIASFRRFFETR